MMTGKYLARKTTLQHASARMLNRYAPWMDYTLTITFGKDKLHWLPDEENARKQVRHLGLALNSAIWGHYTHKNPKCNVLYVPVLEGGTDIKRIHAHVLLGNVKSEAKLHTFLQGYIPRSHWLAPDYQVRSIYAVDGACWYHSKEVNTLNDAAIAWDIAIIPKPLRPR